MEVSKTMPNNIMNTCAVRCLRGYDDDFFIPGNQLSHQDSDMVLSYIEVYDNHDYNDDKDGTGTKEQSSPPVPVYFCPAMGCDEYFTSRIALEDHYESTHVFQCRVSPHCCQKYFPNDHLLDLHITECHDAYFQAMVEKTQNERRCSSGSVSNSERKMKSGHYKCLVMDCKERFVSDDERLKHLNTVHGYPKWFRFHSRCTPTSKRDRRRRRNHHHNHNYDDHDREIRDSNTLDKIRDVKMEHDGCYDNYDVAGVGNSTMCNEDTKENPLKSEALEQKQLQKKEQRRARRKAKNKTIPCKYYHSKRGCWRGEKCMFLHGDIGNGTIDADETSDAAMNIITDTKKNGSDPTICVKVLDNEIYTDVNKIDVDAEMEDLTQKMQTKANITIPQNISFGRRRRRV